MSGDVDITVDTREVVQAIRGFGRRARSIDMGPVAEILKARVDDVYEAEGAVGGRPKWDPLAEETLRRHPRRIGGMILQATGAMANTQTSTSADTATAFSPAHYAIFHTAARRIPKRNPFEVDERATLEEIELYVLEELARG